MIARLLLALVAAAAPSYPQPARPVAAVVSPVWNTEATRDAAHEVEQLTAALDVRPGMTVADLGAGSGYDTVRLARVVGPSGRVLAEDITPSYLEGLRRTVRARGLDHVTVIAGAPDDPKLPRGVVDAAILVHMYHEIAAPYAFLAALAPALKPGARVGVEELNRPTARHGTPPALLRCEFEAMGYRPLSLRPLQGDIGYLAVFAAPATAPRPDAVKPCRDAAGQRAP